MFTFLDERVALRHKRRLSHGSENHHDEQACEETHRTDFGKADKPLRTYRCRHDHVEEIKVVATEDTDGCHHENPAHTLEVGIDQDQDREHEVHDQRQPERQREVVDALYEISNFFRDIRIPDQHELREPKVSPEYAEAEHEFGQIVDVAGVDIRQVTA